VVLVSVVSGARSGALPRAPGPVPPRPVCAAGLGLFFSKRPLLRGTPYFSSAAEHRARVGGVREVCLSSLKKGLMSGAAAHPPPGKPRYVNHDYGSGGQTSQLGSTYWDRDWRFKLEEGPPYKAALARHTQALEQMLKAQGSELASAVGKSCSFVKAWVNFPTSTGLNVNMMPFVLGDKASLPSNLHEYWPLIEACPVQREEKGKVGYLTVMETTAAAAQGGPQRRGGLHTEGFLAPDGFGSLGLAEAEEARAGDSAGKLVSGPHWAAWGGGDDGVFQGGLFMASNVKNSSRVWNVELPREPGGASRVGGDCEHLRETLGAGHYLDAGAGLDDGRHAARVGAAAEGHGALVLPPRHERRGRVVGEALDGQSARHATGVQGPRGGQVCE